MKKIILAALAALSVQPALLATHAGPRFGSPSVTCQSGPDDYMEGRPDPRDSQIVGKVRDREGHPVAGLVMHLDFLTHSSEVICAVGRTDRQGRFAFRHLAYSDYTLAVSSPGHRYQNEVLVDVINLRPKHKTESLTLMASPASPRPAFGKEPVKPIPPKRIVRRAPDPPLTAADLRAFPERFKRLVPGMPKEQVFQTLGLPPYGGRYMALASGPAEAYNVAYTVGPYHFGIVWDDTKTVLKSCKMVSEHWPH